MLVSSVSNIQSQSFSSQKKVNKTKPEIPYSRYYSGGWKQRNLSPDVLKEITKAAEESKAPEGFVRALIGASKGAFYNPTLERDFIFSPENIIGILKAYKPEKQEIFNYLSEQEADMVDSERFSGDQMQDIYIASSKASLDTIKNLVNARNDYGYHKYCGSEIADKLNEQ